MYHTQKKLSQYPCYLLFIDFAKSVLNQYVLLKVLLKFFCLKGFYLGYLVISSSLIRKKQDVQPQGSLVFIPCHSLYHLLSFIVTCCTSRYYTLSRVVTQCTTRLSFYKQSLKISIVSQINVLL